MSPMFHPLDDKSPLAVVIIDTRHFNRDSYMAHAESSAERHSYVRIDNFGAGVAFHASIDDRVYGSFLKLSLPSLSDLSV
jgi:hypothetical protein